MSKVGEYFRELREFGINPNGYKTKKKSVKKKDKKKDAKKWLLYFKHSQKPNLWLVIK